MRETKQIEKTHAKENNHTQKTIFTWFCNLPTSTELQRFHYKIRRYNSAQEHSQETQFPIHPNSLSSTKQENTILSSYATVRLLGLISNSYSLPYITNLIYIYIYIYMGRLVLGIILLVEFGLLVTYMGLWQFKPHRPTSTNYTHCSLFRCFYLVTSMRSYILMSIVEVVLDHTIKLQNSQGL